MPTYDYICISCGKRFERFQGINEAPIGSCPSCGGSGRRVISGGAGFIAREGGKMAATSCGKESPCCGRDEPCGKSHECH